MRDAAFRTAAYPAYTTAELSRWLKDHTEGKTMLAASQYDKVCAELTRRARRDAGDVSAMTDGEKLRRPLPILHGTGNEPCNTRLCNNDAVGFDSDGSALCEDCLIEANWMEAIK